MSDVKQRDFYLVLGVRSDASPEEIEKGFQKRIRRLKIPKHMQTSFLEETNPEEELELVQEAYETLTDQERRDAHDRALNLPARKPAPAPGLSYRRAKSILGDEKENDNKPRKRHRIYEDYFGFSEKPFDLTPDPKFLYLSPKHKEVLAHLVFGLQENNGFLKIVGEVGTGKTTICRSFLNELHSDFNFAYIFNPCLDSLELLKSINTELGIHADSNSKKELIDFLNEFLLQERKKGHRVVIIIDEAQDLDSNVLEQLRLLSNLETDTEKLIQIVLIGQPELNKLLDREELRQLRQRITIHWELLPLNLEETRGYIQHRLNVALGRGKVTFTTSALELIYRHSKGIPRMINVLADRSLLIAYTANTKKIGSKIIRQAAKDAGQMDARTPWSQAALKATLPVLLLLAFMLFVVDYITMPELKSKSNRAKDIEKIIKENPPDLSKPGKLIAGKEAVEQASRGTRTVVSEMEPPGPIVKKVPTKPSRLAFSTPRPLTFSGSDKLVTYLSSLSLMESKIEAAKWMFKTWGVFPENMVGLDEHLFDNLESEYGLLQYELSGNFDRLLVLNYPAILEINLPDAKGTKYLALTSVKDGRGTFGSIDNMEMPLDMIDSLWTRKAIIFWNDYETLPDRFEKGYEGKEAIWLQKNLRLLGFFQGREAPVYGPKTIQAVQQFQRENKITDDGRFHTESKMMLYNLLDIYPTPSLIKQ